MTLTRLIHNPSNTPSSTESNSLHSQEFSQDFIGTRNKFINPHEKISHFICEGLKFKSNIRSLISSSIQAVASQVSETFHAFFKNLVEFYPEDDSFFMQASQESNFKYYQAWCRDLSDKIQEIQDHLYHTTPKTFRKALLALQKRFKTKIQSPIHYQKCLKKLEQELTCAPRYAHICREANVRLYEKLKAHHDVALRCFYDDVINHLILLSGYQIKAHTLLDVITYYEKLVPAEIYQPVMDALRNFIDIHFKENDALAYSYFLRKAIPASHYQSLLSAINHCFCKEDVCKDKPDEQNSSWEMDLSLIKKHPVMSGLIATTAINLLASHCNFNVSWTVVNGATWGYSLYHQTALPFNSGLAKAVTLLPTLFAVSYAQASVFNLASLNGTNGFIINGINNNDQFGNSISHGDINGDNITDLLITASYALNSNAQSYVIFGSKNPFSSFIDLSVTNLDGTNGFTVDKGFYIASGDINGDNRTDLLIGQIFQTYVIYGSMIPFSSNFSVNSLNGTNGFMVNAGGVVGSADINGDQITDLLIGSFNLPAGTNQGICYVVFGSRIPFPTTFNVNSLNGTNGFSVNGAHTNDLFGYAISSGDINNDQADDLFVGAIRAPSGSNRGQVSVIYGSKNPFQASFNISSLNSTQGFLITGFNNYDQLGYSISSGDFNDDQIDDLLIGAPNGGVNVIGQGFVIFGSPNPFPGNFSLSSLDGTNGFVLRGINSFDYTGSFVSSGDINGDNKTDLLISAYGFQMGSSYGQTYVVYGSQTPYPSNFDLSNLNGANGLAVKGIRANDAILNNILSSGDINGDHIDDLFISAPSAPSNSGRQGQVYVIFGPIPNNFLGTTGQVMTTSYKTQVSTSQFSETIKKSHHQNQTLLIGAIAGSAAGILCISGGALVLWKKCRESASKSALELEGPHDSIKPVDELQDTSIAIRQDKSRTIIANHSQGRKYALINKINTQEAEQLFKETGIRVNFIKGKGKIKFTLGEGQYGKVRLAEFLDREKELDLKSKFVGVKKIKGEENIEASKNEAVLQFKLKGQPNIMPLLDSLNSTSSQKKPALYQFMPLAGFGNGKVLRSKLAYQNNISVRNKILVHVAKSLLTGANAMHELNIYHLDLKPENFVLDKEGHLDIIDFGCAVQKQKSHIPEANGDTRYFSPDRLLASRLKEQDSAAAVFDPRKADAWAIGVTLWELATGQYPFDKTSFSDRIAFWDQMYFAGKLQGISALKGRTSESFIELVTGLLEIDPTKRLGIAEALDQPIFKSAKDQFQSEQQQQEAFKLLITNAPNQNHLELASDYLADFATYTPKAQDENYIYSHYNNNVPRAMP